MTRQRTQARRPIAATEAVVWIDGDQAVVVEYGPRGESVERIGRATAESEAAFKARTVHLVVDEDRVVVSGPGPVRTAFERAYVATTHRPDRLVDVGSKAGVPRESQPV